MAVVTTTKTAHSLPLGFVDELFVSTSQNQQQQHQLAGTLVNTGAFAKASNGNVLFFLGSKEGSIRVTIIKDAKHDDGDFVATRTHQDLSDDLSFFTLLELPVCTDGERGVQSLVPHYDFERNGYLYIYRTERNDDDADDGGGCKLDYKEGPHNRLSRFTVVSSSSRDGESPTIDPKSEVSLFRGPTQNGKNHNGGGMAFGNDGFLYITIGDGGSTRDKNSENLQTLNGKVLR